MRDAPSSKRARGTARSSLGPDYHLTYRLDRLSHQAIGRANAAYVAECGLDVRQLRILRLIGRYPGITAGELVERTFLEKTFVSRVLSLLIRRALVVRRIGEEDARQHHHSLTARGSDTIDKAHRLGERLETAFLKPLDTSEQAALRDYIDRLTAWVETLASFID